LLAIEIGENAVTVWEVSIALVAGGCEGEEWFEGMEGGSSGCERMRWGEG